VEETAAVAMSLALSDLVFVGEDEACVEGSIVTVTADDRVSDVVTHVGTLLEDDHVSTSEVLEIFGGDLMVGRICKIEASGAKDEDAVVGPTTQAGDSYALALSDLVFVGEDEACVEGTIVTVTADDRVSDVVTHVGTLLEDDDVSTSEVLEIFGGELMVGRICKIEASGAKDEDAVVEPTTQAGDSYVVPINSTISSAPNSPNTTEADDSYLASNTAASAATNNQNTTKPEDSYLLPVIPNSTSSTTSAAPRNVDVTKAEDSYVTPINSTPSAIPSNSTSIIANTTYPFNSTTDAVSNNPNATTVNALQPGGTNQTEMGGGPVVSGPDYPSVPEESLECGDEEIFEDARGYRCSDWVGYDCLSALSFGFTTADMDAIVTSCRKSCGYCDGENATPSSCEDTDGFFDAKGRACLEWTGYDCLGVWSGYTSEDMLQLRSSCVLSCGLCEEEGPELPLQDDGDSFAGEQCQDSSGFVDAKGGRCSDWVGYDCFQAELYGYSATEAALVTKSCPESCGLCSADLCYDNADFADDRGAHCSDWIGFDCTQVWHSTLDAPFHCGTLPIYSICFYHNARSCIVS
jgi:hypothetical protein